MLALLNAITAKFNATTALTTAFVGGYHLDRAPEGTAMPYLVGSVVAGANAEQSVYGKIETEEVTFRFTAYGVGLVTAGTAAELVTSTFDETLLTLATGKMTNVLRRSAPTPRMMPGVDKNGDEVWGWSWTYDYEINP